MKNIKIEVEEKKTYWQRILYVTLGCSIFMGVGILFVYLMKGPWQMVLGISCLSYAYLWYIIDKRNAYYITLFEIKDSVVHIVFTGRGVENDITDKVEKFIFKRGVSNGGSGNYLEIEYKGDFLLRLYSQWGWKEVLVHLLDDLQNNKVLAKKGIW